MESDRTRPVYDLLAAALFEVAGIRLNEGKTRTWNRAGVCPPDMALLGEEVWCPAGVKVLGTPVGTDAFVEQLVAERLADEQRLWEAIPEVPDLQCAWQLLLQCAGPRANHLLRTVPPTQVMSYAQRHDNGLWHVAEKLLGALPGSPEEVATARELATLPLRLGGLGLRSATRTAPAAWADALAMLQARVPAVATAATAALAGDTEPPLETGGVAQARNAAALLSREGFAQRPSWDQLRHGLRPRAHQGAEPGEFAHGWQSYASSTRGSRVLSTSVPTDCAHLRSHSGRYACRCGAERRADGTRVRGQTT
jgi:hypothetical protein